MQRVDVHLVCSQHGPLLKKTGNDGSYHIFSLDFLRKFEYGNETDFSIYYAGRI
jgi:hypothetical protein